MLIIAPTRLLRAHILGRIAYPLALSHLVVVVILQVAAVRVIKDRSLVPLMQASLGILRQRLGSVARSHPALDKIDPVAAKLLLSVHLR